MNLRLLAATLTTVAITLVTGCGSQRPDSPATDAARGNLSRAVLDIMDSNGLPVRDDSVGCRTDPDGRSDTCHGTTATTPQEEVEGDFTPSGPVGCGGTLTVRVGGNVLQISPEDPCR